MRALEDVYGGRPSGTAGHVDQVEAAALERYGQGNHGDLLRLRAELDNIYDWAEAAVRLLNNPRYLVNRAQRILDGAIAPIPPPERPE